LAFGQRHAEYEQKHDDLHLHLHLHLHGDLADDKDRWDLAAAAS
jgi:hypothetical protein